MPRFWLGGAAPVVVGKSLNVSFAERGAKLNFNENQITGIGTDAMHGPAGHLQAGARARRYHLAVAFELPPGQLPPASARRGDCGAAG